MGTNRPLLLALAISVICHITFALLYPIANSERRVTRFDVELVPRQPFAAVKPQPAASAEDTDRLQDASEPPEAAAPFEESSSSQARATVARPVADAPRKPPAVLNLDRPSNWDEIVNAIPLPPAGKFAFNPALGEGVGRRIRERRRVALVGDRRSAVYGVADEDYARTGALGEELKMDGGCVILMEDKGVEEGQRWWASQCTETRQNRFMLPEVDYDALGRVVAD